MLSNQTPLLIKFSDLKNEFNKITNESLALQGGEDVRNIRFFD